MLAWMHGGGRPAAPCCSWLAGSAASNTTLAWAGSTGRLPCSCFVFASFRVYLPRSPALPTLHPQLCTCPHNPPLLLPRWVAWCSTATPTTSSTRTSSWPSAPPWWCLVSHARMKPGHGDAQPAQPQPPTPNLPPQLSNTQCPTAHPHTPLPPHTPITRLTHTPLPTPPRCHPQAFTTAMTSCCRHASSPTRTPSATAWVATT